MLLGIYFLGLPLTCSLLSLSATISFPGNEGKKSLACRKVHESFADVLSTREDFLFLGNGGADGKFSIEANLLPSLSRGKEEPCGCHVFFS